MNGEQRQLKRALQLLVKSLEGYDAAGLLLGKTHSTVHRWADIHNPDDWIRLSDLRELEANAPEPRVTMALARLAGGVFVPLPQAAGGDEALPMQVMDLVRELGEFSGEVSRGLADTDFSKDDAEKALAQLADVESCAAALRVALMKIAEG